MQEKLLAQKERVEVSQTDFLSESRFSHASSFIIESYKTMMIIGLSIGGVLLALLVAVIIGALIYIKRRKRNPSEKRSSSSTYR